MLSSGLFLLVLFLTSSISIDLNDMDSTIEPTARPSRGDILDDTFQDQVREPIPRGLPGAGRHRNDLDQSRSLLGAERSKEDELDKHFATLPEDKHSPLQSGDARVPYHFHSEEDAVTLSERAYDRVLLDMMVVSSESRNAEGDDSLDKNTLEGNGEGGRRLSEDGNEEGGRVPEEEEENAPEPMLTNEHLREWALFSLNPDLAHLSEPEMEAFDVSYTAFIKRQGFAPPAKVLIPRGFIAGWSATSWLQEVADELKTVRIREEFFRKRREAAATEALHGEAVDNVDKTEEEEGMRRGLYHDESINFEGGGDFSTNPQTSSSFETDSFGDVVDSLGI